MEKSTEVYRLGGVTFVSEIRLPELSAIQHDDALTHPVTIRVGAVATHLTGAVELDPGCFATRTEYLLCIDGVARYLVMEGREIVVEPALQAVPLDVRGYLLGSVFVVLCQQRGLLPLHASAVGGGGGAAAFVAYSGHGKSTLAAYLATHRRGLRVLADDVCLLHPDERPVMVIPTAPWLKLWPASLERLGRPADGLERVFSDEEKFRLPVEAGLAPEAIREVFFLEWREGVSVTTVEAISSVEAVDLLMHFTHHAFVIEGTGQREALFRRCGKVLAQVRAWRLVRPWGLESLDGTAEVVLGVLES